jgi:type IV secretory pathway component VirB8
MKKSISAKKLSQLETTSSTNKWAKRDGGHSIRKSSTLLVTTMVAMLFLLLALMILAPVILICGLDGCR